MWESSNELSQLFCIRRTFLARVNHSVLSWSYFFCIAKDVKYFLFDKFTFWHIHACDNNYDEVIYFHAIILKNLLLIVFNVKYYFSRDGRYHL